MSVPVRSVIRFKVKPGRQADFEAAFADCGMLSRPRAVAGFIEAQLLRGLDGSPEYLVIGSWASVEAYRTWQGVSAVDAPKEPLARLVDTLQDPAPGSLFEVAAGS